jgi:hypothetical protein
MSNEGSGRRPRPGSRFGGVVWQSAAMDATVEQLRKIAASDSTVLITGETGTGKEVVARAIHDHSRRRECRFVALHCGALNQDMIESELFGHARGAFTGAVTEQQGFFEYADRGSIFLDEIGTTTLAVQVRLLRVLQDHVIVRMGERTPRAVNVRVLAATNSDLQTMVREKTFREDLFYRLNVLTVELPPLRARREDIAILADYFIQRLAPHSGIRLSGDAVNALSVYQWPGNVRELENTIERAVAMRRDDVIDVEDLRVTIPEAPPSGGRIRRPASAAVVQPSPTPIGRVSKMGSWDLVEWDRHVPMLLGALLVYRDSRGRDKRARIDAGHHRTGHMASATYYRGGKAKIERTLAEWRAPGNRGRSFQPVIDNVAIGDVFTYDRCVESFRLELEELECLPAGAEMPLPASSIAGELRLIRAVPGVRRDQLAADFIQRERAGGRLVIPGYGIDGVGRDASDLGNSLVIPFANAIDQAVTADTIASVVARQGRPVSVVINGFAPAARSEDEWRALLQLFQRLKPLASIVMFQTANPCHGPMPNMASAPVVFEVTNRSAALVPEYARQAVDELRLCCQHAVLSATFDRSHPCAAELTSAGLVEADGGSLRVVPVLRAALAANGVTHE